jgi:predicted transcriptional regulator
MPLSLTSTPAVSIRKEDQVWVAAGMLVHYLESFTDSLVVTDEHDRPIGVIGGIEIIKGIFENPSASFFEQSIEKIMDYDLVQITSDITLETLMEKWQKTRRAFCVIPNQYSGFSAISARKLLEVGTRCKTDLKASDFPKKDLITFMYDDTMGKIMSKMIENKTRKLLFKNSNGFISDRTIIQFISQDLNFFKDTDNFLDLKFEERFKLPEIKPIPESLNFTDISKLMFSMLHPYVTFNGQVISPWDICLTLLNDDISLQ